MRRAEDIIEVLTSIRGVRYAEPPGLEPPSTSSERLITRWSGRDSVCHTTGRYRRGIAAGDLPVGVCSIPSPGWLSLDCATRAISHMTGPPQPSRAHVLISSEAGTFTCLRIQRRCQFSRCRYNPRLDRLRPNSAGVESEARPRLVRVEARPAPTASLKTREPVRQRRAYMAATTNPWTERMAAMCAQAAEIAEILASELSVAERADGVGPKWCGDQRSL